MYQIGERTRFAQTLAHFVCGSTGSVRVGSTGEFTPVIQDGGCSCSASSVFVLVRIRLTPMWIERLENAERYADVAASF